MKEFNTNRANTLIEALPYIQDYYGKTIVIKYGGNAMINSGLKESVIKDIILMSLVGIKVVLVHGGGPDINKFLRKINKVPEFINGLRYTDEETAEIVQMVLAGKVNKELVGLINNYGGKGIGLCGIDGKMLKAKKNNSFVDLGFVGEIEKVNTDIINDSLSSGYITVIATVAKGEDGKTYNINADLAASKIAAALKAEKLILLTDVRGLLKDFKDDDSLISRIKLSEIPSLIENKIISGGMIPKIDCCEEAIRLGVKKAHIIDGRIPNSILLEMFSDLGIGTLIEG
ncbi:acetylglutamate kinase [Clostridium cavendishii]|nr:acetylglutamate kinase [Clostridium cavendishii]